MTTGLGALCAVAASTLFSVGLVFQALEARTISGDHAFKLSLIGELIRRPRWVLGGVVMLAGFAFHVAAFLLAPLTVVQPALAAGLLALLWFGLRAQGQAINRREALGVAGVVLGIVALTFTTPGRTADETDSRSVLIALGALAVVALAAHFGARARRGRGGGTSLLAALGAGVGYSMTGLTTKLLSDALADGDLLRAAGWLVGTALVAALVFIDQNSALQDRDVIEVGPIVFVVPVVVPVLLAPALVGEGWGNTPAGVVPLLLSLAVVCAGAAILSGSAGVAAATEVSDGQL